MRNFWLFVFSFLPLFSAGAFQDISLVDPDREIFWHLRDTGIMGQGSQNFLPDSFLTREQAVAVALRAGGKIVPENIADPPFFADVDPNSPFADSIFHAAKVGIVNQQNPVFRPREAITKAEFLAFLFRATGVKFQNYFTRTQNIAADIASDDWFAPHFAHAKKYQIAHLTPENFYFPNEFLTRRRAAIMTFRQLKVFHASPVATDFLELESLISQFLTDLQRGENERAATHLPEILKISDRLSRTRNDKNAVGARAISQSIRFFSASLRDFKFSKNLSALENLHLAEKFAHRAAQTSDQIAPFATQMTQLIHQTILTFSTPEKPF